MLVLLEVITQLVERSENLILVKSDGNHEAEAGGNVEKYRNPWFECACYSVSAVFGVGRVTGEMVVRMDRSK